MRDDHHLRQIRFCRWIASCFENDDTTDGGAAFGSNLDISHIATLHFEFCIISVIVAAFAGQNRLKISEAHLVLPRTEPIEPKGALFVGCPGTAKSAESCFITLYFETH